MLFTCDAENRRVGIDRREVATRWEKCEYLHPRYLPDDGFCCTFPCYEKFMGKPMHISCDVDYHRVRI